MLGAQSPHQQNSTSSGQQGQHMRPCLHIQHHQPRFLVIDVACGPWAAVLLLSKQQIEKYLDGFLHYEGPGTAQSFGRPQKFSKSCFGLRNALLTEAWTKVHWAGAKNGQRTQGRKSRKRMSAAWLLILQGNNAPPLWAACVNFQSKPRAGFGCNCQQLYSAGQSVPISSSQKIQKMGVFLEKCGYDWR